MKYAGKLSDASKQKSFAICIVCDMAFVDDVLDSRSIKCPNGCGCDLRRGVDLNEIAEQIENSADVPSDI